jgi:SWI/SNF-related matrix-associated actin-dependent regulator of chromatin subfamily B protein 1
VNISLPEFIVFDHLSKPRKIDPEEVNKSEVLVPIWIEFDVDHHKMREAFIWNLNGVL